MHTRHLGKKTDGDRRFLCWTFPNSKQRFLRKGDLKEMGKTNKGKWKKSVFCRDNGRIMAFQLRLQAYTSGDNSGLTAIRLLCETDKR